MFEKQHEPSCKRQSEIEADPRCGKLRRCSRMMFFHPCPEINKSAWASEPSHPLSASDMICLTYPRDPEAPFCSPEYLEVESQYATTSDDPHNLERPQLMCIPAVPQLAVPPILHLRKQIIPPDHPGRRRRPRSRRSGCAAKYESAGAGRRLQLETNTAPPPVPTSAGRPGPRRTRAWPACVLSEALRGGPPTRMGFAGGRARPCRSRVSLIDSETDGRGTGQTQNPARVCSASWNGLYLIVPIDKLNSLRPHFAGHRVTGNLLLVFSSPRRRGTSARVCLPRRRGRGGPAPPTRALHSTVPMAPLQGSRGTFSPTLFSRAVPF